VTTPRRIVTGHDEEGRSVVIADGTAPKTRAVPGTTFHEIWCTSGAPAPIAPVEPHEPTDRAALVVPPDAEGTNIRIIDLEPRSRSPMHRTETIDYGIVLAGNVTLILDDGETELAPGDVVVQRGTNHAWANPSDEPARMAFVLVDGRFTPELEALLPAGYELLDSALEE
jgi:quercetin dioxygenase-like cupin family protein